MEAIEFYKNCETPPEWALKSIGAGRLQGMTDINPQWRIKMLVDNFGFCGIGWKYVIKRLWFEDCQTERLAFAEIELFIKDNDKWSDPVPGIGGSKMMAQEKSGIHNSDECYKMAVTDALSVACKMLGIGAAVYSGSKYIPVLKQEVEENEKADKEAKKAAQSAIDLENFLREVDSVKDRPSSIALYTKYKHLLGNLTFDAKVKELSLKYPQQKQA